MTTEASLKSNLKAFSLKLSMAGTALNGLPRRCLY